jgi:hypothetical protein
VGVVNLRRHVRLSAKDASRADARKSLFSVLAIIAVAGFVAVPLAGPAVGSASAWFVPGGGETASLVVIGSGLGLEREEFGVSGGWGSAPAVGRPDPGTAQAYAMGQLVAQGWDQGEFGCLVALWSKESGWNHFAQNRSSGAYGIPQALPGEKMASAGADWATNPETQIRWGLGYIEARYGSPCAAWGHSQQKNWY